MFANKSRKAKHVCYMSHENSYDEETSANSTIHSLFFIFYLQKNYYEPNLNVEKKVPVESHVVMGPTATCMIIYNIPRHLSKVRVCGVP